jgi:non-canonical purine NTP pyrophosphatase (RdgB/HAM1 family)
MKTIHIVSKNKWKVLGAKEAFAKYGIEIKPIKKEYPEIQADSSLEIAKHTALMAAKEFDVPVVREDHSLFLNELGIPGPYTHYMESRIPAEKLASLLKKDRRGYFEAAAVYAEPDGFTKSFILKVPIKIAKKPRGNRGNCDRILMLGGSNKTFAEAGEWNEETVWVWNKNFVKIAKYILKRKYRGKCI